MPCCRCLLPCFTLPLDAQLPPTPLKLVSFLQESFRPAGPQAGCRPRWVISTLGGAITCAVQRGRWACLRSSAVGESCIFFLAVAALPLGATLATRSRLDGTHSHKVVKLRNHISVLQTACPLRASLGGCMPSLRYVKMKYWVYFSSFVGPFSLVCGTIKRR